jgi:hypothetical protein
MGHFVRHGDLEEVVRIVNSLASEFEAGVLRRPGRPAALDRYTRESLMPQMIHIIEEAA